MFDADLKGVKIKNNNCHIGASTTVTEFGNSELINKIFPDLPKYLKLVSSTPIRNMATLGGNIVNASPIGDMTIFFLALDSTLVLNDGISKRIIPLKELFLDYKKLDKSTNEFIESIQFPVPDKTCRFNFEKVSKRTHLDIASVNSACLIKLNADHSIGSAHISAGGVAAIPKYLHQSPAFLKNKKLDNNTLTAFVKILDAEIAPISDAPRYCHLQKVIIASVGTGSFY